MIWDFEFKRYKSADLYEEFREELDNQKSRLALIVSKIEGEKNNPTMEKGDADRLKDDKERLDKSIEKTEAKMRDVELEMHGSGPCAEYPQGLQGVDQTVDALHELIGIMKKYLKTL